MTRSPLPLVAAVACGSLILSSLLATNLSSVENETDSKFDSYGGNRDFTAEATGFFYLKEFEGRHFLVTPKGHGYRALGINHFHMMSSQDYDGAIQQIKDWGFNAGCYQGPRWMWNRHPYTKGITLVPTSPYKSDDHFGFRDVFSQEFLVELEKTIQNTVEPQSENPFLIGYFWTDIGLWERDRKGESWLSFFQSLPADSEGGKVWAEWKAEHPDADENEFLPLIARELYSHAHDLIRKYDENHLIFGDRWHEVDMPEAVVRESLPYVDAIAIQPTSRGYNHQFFDAVFEEYGKPIYIADHVSSFATEEFPVTMGQKAENPEDFEIYYEEYVTTAFATPYLIGFNKCQYQDQGNPGQMLKQGLIKASGVPYSVVDAVGDANRKALKLAYSNQPAEDSEPKAVAAPQEAAKEFTVSMGESFNGAFIVSPEVPEDGIVAAGTVLTLTATPSSGFTLDSLYSAVSGFKSWTVYREAMADPWEVTVDQDMMIGASFIKASEVAGIDVTHDVVYAQPGRKALKYDVFSPKGAANLPGIVIIHGGGWGANTEDVMRGLGRELARDGKYVVFSIDYRWLGDRDGDEEPNTLVDLIEDVFGAIAHLQEHGDNYGLDPTRLAVTGDSAGGHLSASAANMAGMIGDAGYGETEGVFEFLPSYLPTGKSAAEVRKEISAAIQAAAPSYGIFGSTPVIENSMQNHPSGDWEHVAPIKTIPEVSNRAVPQLLLRGTKDWIKDENVQAYADALQAAGQRVEYVQPEGASHAFLDWKPEAKFQATFRKFGVEGAATMITFFDSVFYPES